MNDNGYFGWNKLKASYILFSYYIAVCAVARSDAEVYSRTLRHHLRLWLQVQQNILESSFYN